MVEWQFANWEEYNISDTDDSATKVEDTTDILFVEDDDTIESTVQEQICLYNLTQELDSIPCPVDIETMHMVAVYPPEVKETEKYYPVPVRIKNQTRQSNHHNAMAVSVLNAHFDDNTKPSYLDKQNLANETGMTIPQVSMWFNNKRKRN